MLVELSVVEQRYQAVLAVQELDAENVAAIIGPIVTAEPAAYEAQSRGIPIILFTQKLQEMLLNIGALLMLFSALTALSLLWSCYKPWSNRYWKLAPAKP